MTHCIHGHGWLNIDGSCSACERQQLERERPSDEAACSAGVADQLKRLADDWFARAVDEMDGAVKEKNARDGVNFYQHTARAAVLSDCRRQLMKIILPNEPPPPVS